MTEYERLFASLRGQPRDRLPWYADLSWHYHSLRESGALDPRYDGEDGIVKLHRDLGAGICFYSPRLWIAETIGVEIQVDEEAGRRLTRIVTPLGTVRQTETYLPKSYAYAIRENFVKDIGDLKIMLYLEEHKRYRPNYAQYERAAAATADIGYYIGYLEYAAPLQRMLSRWAGAEATVWMLADEPDECRAIFRGLVDADRPILEIVCGSPAGLIEICDNLSSETTGVYNFLEWNAELYKGYADALHRAGKLVSIHIDGTLKGCLRLLSDCGFDAAESVTPAPVGDLPVERLREEAGNTLALWGGLPGAIFSPLYGEEQFEAYLRMAIECFSRDPRSILGTADQIPPDGLLHRVRRVAEAIAEYSR